MRTRAQGGHLQSTGSSLPLGHVLAQKGQPAIGIVQLTDLYLMADPQARLMEVCTQTSLQRILQLVRQRCDQVDRLIITGDLAHHERLDPD